VTAGGAVRTSARVLLKPETVKVATRLIAVGGGMRVLMVVNPKENQHVI
jgi:hypothetical protein